MSLTSGRWARASNQGEEPAHTGLPLVGLCVFSQKIRWRSCNVPSHPAFTARHGPLPCQVAVRKHRGRLEAGFNNSTQRPYYYRYVLIQTSMNSECFSLHSGDQESVSLGERSERKTLGTKDRGCDPYGATRNCIARQTRRTDGRG